VVQRQNQCRLHAWLLGADTGVTPEIVNDALKIHYRKLVADNHPDKMFARGVPPEFVAFATKKIAAINAAYKEIAKARCI
jgi:DnaJ like chaperone protein